MVCGRSTVGDKNGKKGTFAQGGRPFAWWRSTVDSGRKNGAVENGVFPRTIKGLNELKDVRGVVEEL